MRKRYNTIVTYFALQLFGILIITTSLAGCNHTITMEESARIDTLTHYLEEGDIVFRKGEGLVSRAVVSNDIGGKYSHIGMVVRDGDSLKIAHAVPGEPDYENDFDRVKCDAISTFFSQKYAVNGAITRLPLTQEQKSILSREALQKVKQKTKFDHNYNLNDTTKLYCTEFIQLIYSKVGIDICEGRRSSLIIPGIRDELIMPSDMYDNSCLKTIYYY